MRVLGAFLLAVLMLLPIASRAQDDDRGFLQSKLEELLSDAGREVRITGFEGALSSQARIAELTIADEDGIWLTITDAVLDWNRGALFRGQLEVTRLAAREILLPRMPGPGQAAAPSPEATGFSLPELPVSVGIGEIAAERIRLGEDLFGLAADLTLAGSLTLDGGEGAVSLQAERLDGPVGRFALDAGFANATRVMALDLLVEEEADGIMATLANLPGRPSLRFSAQGEAPLSDFTARIALATDGQDRLRGAVRVADLSQDTPEAGRAFAANLSGDVTPLFPPDYATFFGPDAALKLEGTRSPDGGLDIGTFILSARTLALDGRVLLQPGGLPERIAVAGRIASGDGKPVLLPIPGTPTRVGRVDLDVAYDASESEAWTGAIMVNGLDRAGFSAETLALDGSGRIGRGADGDAFVEAAFEFAARSLDLGSEAAEQALGETVTGRADIGWRTGQPVLLRSFELAGGTYDIAATGAVAPVEGGVRIDLDGDLAARDLSAFAGLAARPLGGAIDARVTLGTNPIAGTFELALDAQSRDLRIGQAEFDRLIAGRGTVALKARRDATGTYVESLDVATPTAAVLAEGALRTGASRGSVDARVTDAGLLVPGLSGPAAVVGRGTQRGDLWDVSVALAGTDTDASAAGIVDMTTAVPQFRGGVRAAAADLSSFSGIAGRALAGALSAEASGNVGLDLATFDIIAEAEGQDLKTGIPEVDLILAGATSASIDMRRNGGRYTIRDFGFDSRLLQAAAQGSVRDGTTRVAFDATLRDIAPFVADLSGALTASGTAEQGDGDWTVSVSASGPGGSSANVDGTVAPDASSVDLAVRGRAPLALAGRALQPRAIGGNADFDLRIAGAPGVDAITGRVTTGDARFADPNAGISLDNIRATIGLGSGRAQVDVAGDVRDGGRVTLGGPVTLRAPFNGDLDLTLREVVVRDPALYETSIDGTLSISGPLTGGALISGRLGLGTTEVRIPSGSIGGPGDIPEIVHLNEPAAVRATRDRAGITATTQSASNVPPFGLDMLIVADNRIFIRGRGLEAEMGGRLRVGGTTAAVVPNGEFALIRGRLDLFGRRLNLSEGSVTLRGDFDAFVRMEATSTVEDVTIRIVIEGPVTDPQISFLSEPALPEDEVVARLLFGKGIDTLSPLQAAQLAASVRTLTGKGGPGLLDKLRESTGLDDFDVTTDEAGTTSVRAGRYLTEDLYSDVVVNSEGQTEINLNYDISPRVTAKGSVTSEGETGFGIFFERDY